jgi:hypothetical protein
MKKTFILLSLIVLAFSANAFAQAKKPAKKPATKQTIVKQTTAKQFFLNLSDDYVVGTADDKEGALIFPSAISADYLEFMVSDELVPKSMAGDFKEPEGLGSLRVFRGKGRTIIGLRFQLGDRTNENPTIDSVKVFSYLLENKDGKWTDVTASLLPKISIDEAHQSVIDKEDTKDAKKEDVWIETQFNNDKAGLGMFARVKGNDSITTLKFFSWDGMKFVEVE